MKTVVFIAIFIAVWVALQAWILPKMGISTWMRDACRVAGPEKQSDKQPEKQIEEKKPEDGGQHKPLE